jgi:hypothetical protein
MGKRTELMNAASNGKVKRVQNILQNFGSRLIPDEAWKNAISNGNDAIIKELLGNTKSVPDEAFVSAANSGKLSILESLLESNFPSKAAVTNLVTQERVESLKLIFNASESAYLRDRISEDAVSYAVNNGKVHLLQLLVDSGAKVEAAQITAAVENGNTAVFSTLANGEGFKQAALQNDKQLVFLSVNHEMLDALHILLGTVQAEVPLKIDRLSAILEMLPITESEASRNKLFDRTPHPYKFNAHKRT